MAISKSVSMGSIVTGCSLLVLTSISVICGGVVMSRLTKNAAFVSVGLWGLYVSTQLRFTSNGAILCFATVSHLFITSFFWFTHVTSTLQQ